MFKRKVYKGLKEYKNKYASHYAHLLEISRCVKKAKISLKHEKKEVKALLIIEKPLFE